MSSGESFFFLFFFFFQVNVIGVSDSADSRGRNARSRRKRPSSVFFFSQASLGNSRRPSFHSYVHRSVIIIILSISQSHRHGDNVTEATSYCYFIIPIKSRHQTHVPQRTDSLDIAGRDIRVSANPKNANVSQGSNKNYLPADQLADNNTVSNNDTPNGHQRGFDRLLLLLLVNLNKDLTSKFTAISIADQSFFPTIYLFRKRHNSSRAERAGGYRTRHIENTGWPLIGSNRLVSLVPKVSPYLLPPPRIPAREDITR